MTFQQIKVINCENLDRHTHVQQKTRTTPHLFFNQIKMDLGGGGEKKQQNFKKK